MLQQNIRWKSLEKIYKISMLLHCSDVNISAKLHQTFFFCPARSAGFLNPLTRKIVFVRACGVRPSVRTPFPFCDFATFWANRLIWKLLFWMKIRVFAAHSFFQHRRFWKKNTRFCGSFPIWKSTILDENTRFCGSFLIWKSTILDENTRFCGSFPI